jgi:serine/threonine protein kinase
MRVGRYELIAKLGAGGMGIVYKALDPEHDRHVAIKMIGNHATIETTLFVKNACRLPEGRDARRRMALIKEARLVNELNHPNIVRVYDYGVHVGLLYIVMEYLEGQSFDGLLLSIPPRPLAHKIAILAQMCDGLDFAHRRGVIHRDVKPANTFVCSDGVVKVLDFGIAAKLADDDGKPNSLAGTIPYMAPEVISGKAPLGAGVDIWAAGIALYESVAGKTPFAAPALGQTMTRIVHTPHPPLPRDVPGVDEVEKILSLALAKNPAGRYASAGELAAALRRLELVGTPPAPVLGRTQFALPEQPTTRARGFAFDIGLGQTGNTVSTGSRSIAARQWIQKLGSVDFSSFLPWLMIGAFLSFSPLGWLILGLTFVGYFLLKIARFFLRFLEYLQALPRCRHCKAWMREKTQWTRFAHTDDAVNLGFSDCVAALEFNLWEDAAKLLSLHGDETSPTITHSVVSAPIRYHLGFFECQPCDHQCARIAVEDKIEQDWFRRPEQFEAYKAGEVPRLSRSASAQASTIGHSLIAAARTTIQEFTRSSYWIITVLGSVVVFFVLAWLLKFIIEFTFSHSHMRVWRT